MSKITDRIEQGVGKSRNEKIVDDHGLCAVCKNDPACIYPRAPERPVLHCEELAVDAASALRKSWNNPSSSDPVVRFSPERFRKMQRVT